MIDSFISINSYFAQMRRTWIPRLSNYSNNQIEIIFIIAVHENEAEALNKTIEESKNFKDLLVLNLKDSYRMWTIKTLSVMDYIVSRCSSEIGPNATYPLFLRLTQDVLINPKSLLNLFFKLSTNATQRFCAGRTINGGVLRSPESIWYVPEYVYNSVTYGEYCQGCGFFVSFPAMVELVQYGYCLNSVMYIDDGVITGIMREKLKIELIKTPLECVNLKEYILQSIAVNESASKYKEYSILHNQPQINPNEYDQIWNYLLLYNLL